VSPTIPNPRHLHNYGTDTGHNLSFRQVAMANKPRMTCRRCFIEELRKQRGQLSFQRLLYQLTRPRWIKSVSGSVENPFGSRKAVMVSFVMWHIPFSP